MLFLSYQKNSHSLATTQKIDYAALPTNENTFSDSISSTDARVEMIRQFLSRYNSPLEPYSQDIVDTADKYSLDFRLIPAIAMQESGLCKTIPPNSYNCWGFGIYTGHTTMFNNYPEAIEKVSETLATKYKNNGLETPEQIMTMYTPSSKGSWANGVNNIMNQLQ